jgi:hypothetical protein
LGSSDGDVEDIIRHTFFDSIDFEKLLDKQVSPPYQPIVSKEKSGGNDQFAHSFKVDWNHSVGGNTMTDNGDFKNFSFVGPSGPTRKP